MITVENSPDDLRSEAGFDRLVKRVMEMSKQELEFHLGLIGYAAIVVTQEPYIVDDPTHPLGFNVKWKPISKPGVVFLIGPPMSSPMEKDQFSETIRYVARYGQAIGVIFSSEVWAVLGDYGRSMEEQRALYEKYQGDLSAHPDRKEAVMVMVERTGHIQQYLGEIKRSPDEKSAIVCDYQLVIDHRKDEGLEMQGRFVNVLPESQPTN